MNPGHSPEIRAFIRQHSSLFWYTPEDKKEEISEELLLETILNYGTLESVKKLFELIGIEKAFKVFKAQINNKRNNYFLPVKNFFVLYFNAMHKEILSNKQFELLPLIKEFSNQFFLVGGTAIGLQIGHRQSIDFDLFSNKLIKPQSIKNKLKKQNISYGVIHQEYDQLHLMINEVKMTFFTFPYQIPVKESYENIIKMPALLDLGAMKALALGGRAKWRDYIDMYFLLKYYFSLHDIEQKAKELFDMAFSAKLFRQQLAYFKDIDYSEVVFYMKEKPTKSEIETFLIKVATTKF